VTYRLGYFEGMQKPEQGDSHADDETDYGGIHPHHVGVVAHGLAHQEEGPHYGIRSHYARE